MGVSHPRTNPVLLNEGRATVAYQNDSPDYEEVILLHTADTAGELYVSVGGGNMARASSCMIPRNVAVGPWRMPPGARIQAESGGGDRTLNVFSGPVPPLGRVEVLLHELATAVAKVAEAIWKRGAR